MSREVSFAPNNYSEMRYFKYLKHILNGLSQFTKDKDIPTLDEFDSTLLYKDIYHKLVNEIKNNCEKYLSENYWKNPYYKTDAALKEEAIFHYTVRLLYANPNSALDDITRMIAPLVNAHQSISNHSLPKRIIKYLKNGNKIHMKQPLLTDTKMDNHFICYTNTSSPISMPSIRRYNTKTKNVLRELRMGTQAQYCKGTPTINSVFTCWLENMIGDGSYSDDTDIQHVYFNTLSRDRDKTKNSKTQREHILEEHLTNELHLLEYNYKHVAVITLPSNKVWMDKNFIAKKEMDMSYAAAFQAMFDVANGTSNEAVQDFHISKKIQAMLYQSEEKKARVLKKLLHLSFEKILGLSEDAVNEKKITSAEFQAVYFHFIKYELTNFILEKLNPTYFNISYKEGINHADESSAYYNLIRSIENKNSLSENQFNFILRKNNQTPCIWNAISAFIDTNTKTDPHPYDIPKWLMQWRNKNAPKNTKYHAIEIIRRELWDYIAKRKLDKNDFQGFRRDEKRKREHKISAGTKLMKCLNDGIDPQFTQIEYEALNDGTLSKIREKIEKAGVNLPSSYLKAALASYKFKRENESEYAWFYFFKPTHKLKANKLCIATRLESTLENSNHDSVLSAAECKTLTDGRLGEIWKISRAGAGP